MLKKDLAAKTEALADSEIQISALDAQLQGASSEFELVVGPLVMSEELDRELKRARRHRYDVSGIAIGLDTRHTKSSAEDGNRVAALAGILNTDNRVEDRIGMLDARRMIIIMPHTKIENARILAERILFSLKSQDTITVPPLLVYITSFAKEGNVTAKKFGISLARGIDSMAMDRQSPGLTWNQSGQTSWR
jgi:GGDEF domain-containing protein